MTLIELAYLYCLLLFLTPAKNVFANCLQMKKGRCKATFLIN